MSKTIRVIYLLNKIANGEELPEKIEYSGKEWRLGKNDNKDTDYINDKNIGLFYEYLDSILIESLNDNVEIIEEQEEIDIQDINNRLKRLENMVDRFEYIEKRVETIDSQSGIFRYC